MVILEIDPPYIVTLGVYWGALRRGGPCRERGLRASLVVGGDG